MGKEGCLYLLPWTHPWSSSPVHVPLLLHCYLHVSHGPSVFSSSFLFQETDFILHFSGAIKYPCTLFENCMRHLEISGSGLLTTSDTEESRQTWMNASLMPPLRSSMREFLSMHEFLSKFWSFNVTIHCFLKIEVMQHASYAVRKWWLQRNWYAGICSTFIAWDHGWRDSTHAPLAELLSYLLIMPLADHQRDSHLLKINPAQVNFFVLLKN